ncbi:MAG: SGNH/GDSL hydrolase family protein [Planctomycetota bacterium]|nr:MAG: SGNH/GDSL hydrolase family protein [Planctomycetota bacterium]
MPRLPPSIIAVALVALVLPTLPGAAAEMVVELAGDWKVRVAHTAAGVMAAGTFVVAPPDIVEVLNEKIPTLPLFNSTVPGWVKGVALKEVKAAECTVIRALDPDSLVVKTAPGREGAILERGRDWEADSEWGTVGRLAEGRVAEGQPVWASYRAALRRIDSVVRLTDGTLELVHGEPQIVLCEPPSIPAGSERLVNVYLPGRIETLSDANLFPILESVCPPLAPDQPPQARARLPETLRRLEAGEKLKILAWGDSVTTYGRWQSMFVERLKARYPQADIELVTEAWGGRNTGSYLAEPPGSEHNYREKVLDARPHLIVSEFVNDAGMTPADVDRQYGRLLADFRDIGAEWIVLTPHYVMPEWMGPGFLERGQRDIDDDPRPYVAGLKAFVAAHPEPVVLADAARRYGRLWRQGIPYLTLMENNINHPNVAGHRIFADALDEVFGTPD